MFSNIFNQGQALLQSGEITKDISECFEILKECEESIANSNNAMDMIAKLSNIKTAISGIKDEIMNIINEKDITKLTALASEVAKHKEELISLLNTIKSKLS